MKITDVRNQLPRAGTQDTAHTLGQITKIIVHHDAQWRSDNYDSVARYKAQANYHISKGEDGLQYHYKIDNVGEVFQCRTLTDTLWHAANYPVNRASIAICLDGDFTQQEPTREQYTALKELLINLCTQHPEFPAAEGDVFGHTEVSQTGTACPGRIINFVKAFRTQKTNLAIPQVPFNDGSMGVVIGGTFTNPKPTPQTATPEVPAPQTPPAEVYKGEPITPKVEEPVIVVTPVPEVTVDSKPETVNQETKEETKEVPMESKKFSLNKADLLKIAKGAGIALLGALGTYLLTLVGVVDLGVYTPFVAGALSVVANAMIKFASGK